MTDTSMPITDPNKLNQLSVRFLVKSWPLRWRLISALDKRLPRTGRVRNYFYERAFVRPWSKWHRFAYIREYRDVFFEYILRFFYKYSIQKGDVVVQIGASGGEETIRFARSVGKAGHVIAIEPDPTNHVRLNELFISGEFPQVTVIPKAAGHKTGRFSFFHGFEKEGRMADIPADDLTFEWWGVEDHLNVERYKGEILVDCDTPENILAPFDLAHIDFLLIETNGTELEIVEALDTVLPIVRRIGARGHVKRDGQPIFTAIEAHLQKRGFETSVTNEGMVLAQRKNQTGLNYV